MAAFPRASRLTRPREFETVLAEGRRVQDKLLTCAFRANALPHARLGLAIAARAVPKATDRNRVKRQVRESFRGRFRDLPPLDLVVLARPGAAGASPDALRQQCESLWRRLPAQHN